MRVNKQSIKPSDTGPDPWDISVGNGHVHVDDQSIPIPSEDATIVLNESETLTLADDQTEILAHIAWYDAEADSLRILQFDQS